MKISDHSYQKTFFNSLHLGDVFRLGGNLYMKVSKGNLYMKVSNCYTEVNAYNISNCELGAVAEDMAVEYIPSELILHNKDWKPEG